METIWFHRTERCEIRGDMHPRRTVLGGGATLLARNPQYDAALIELNAAVPEGVVYAGWTTDEPYRGQSVYLIGHARAKRAKYAESNIRLIADSVFSWVPDEISKDVIGVTWTWGRTEAGNSGSARFNRDRHIIGIAASGTREPTCEEPTELSAASFRHFYPHVARWLGEGGESPDQLGRIRTLTVPYLPAKGAGAAQGFVILQNRSDIDADVDITAWDDEGASYGPTTVTVPALRAFGFNTTDLEEGDERMTGVGDGEGHWRLTLRTRGNIVARPYARVPGGFVTALGDRAPPIARGRTTYRVDFFNPASNASARSVLRVVNPHGVDNEVTITGVDARGEPGLDVVTLTVPARSAVHLTSVHLEQGGELTEGALGDGEGKWRLTVEGSSSLYALSLLYSAGTGHLTNLSR